MKKILFIVPFFAFIIVSSFVNKNSNALNSLPADIQKNIFLLQTAFTQEELLKASIEDIKTKTGIEMSDAALKQLKKAITYQSKIANTSKKSSSESSSKDLNIFAILGFVFAFLVSIAGLVLSIIGLVKSKKMEGKGRGLSIAGIVISSVVFLVTLIAIIAVVALTTAAVAAV